MREEKGSLADDATDAFCSATLNSATYIGLDGDLGSLEPGKLADLIMMQNGRLSDAATMSRERPGDEGADDGPYPIPSISPSSTRVYGPLGITATRASAPRVFSPSSMACSTLFAVRMNNFLPYFS